MFWKEFLWVEGSALVLQTKSVCCKPSSQVAGVQGMTQSEMWSVGFGSRVPEVYHIARCASDTLKVSRHAWGYLHPHGQALFWGCIKAMSWSILVTDLLVSIDKVWLKLVKSLPTPSHDHFCLQLKVQGISDCICRYGHGCSLSKGSKHWHSISTSRHHVWSVKPTFLILHIWMWILPKCYGARILRMPSDASAPVRDTLKDSDWRVIALLLHMRLVWAKSMLITLQDLICSQRLRLPIPVSSQNLLVDLSFCCWPVSIASKAQLRSLRNEAMGS